MATDRALIERFLEMLAAEAGAAANTIAAYRSDLSLASEVLGGGLVEADAAALQRLAEAWRALAKSSVARKSAALRRFYAFLVDEGHRADDPGAALPRPGTARPLPKVLSVGDVDALFGVIGDRLASATPT
ncbi:site-specific integrase, partial [Sphingomonas aquatilis]